MLRKLMKYEFMAMGRIFLPLYGALLINSIFNSIFGRLELDVPTIVGILLSVLLICGILVVTFLLIIQRFWTNLLSSEGYLMMTLPVRTDYIILSKLFVASIWSVASTIVVTLAIFIMLSAGISFADIIEALKGVIGWIPLEQYQIAIVSVELLVSIVLGTLSGTLLLYACMSLSMLANKYRWLVAIGAYVAWTTAMQTVAVVFISVGAASGLFDAIERFMRSFSTFGTILLSFAAYIVVESLLLSVYYIATRYMLRSRLNLQ